jgi:hypothetical protein
MVMLPGRGPAKPGFLVIIGAWAAALATACRPPARRPRIMLTAALVVRVMLSLRVTYRTVRSEVCHVPLEVFGGCPEGEDGVLEAQKDISRICITGTGPLSVRRCCSV